MSACAGSSTKLFWQVYLLRAPGESGPQEFIFQAFRRPGPNGPRQAGKGFMSTQRRENRWQRISCTGRARRLGATFLAPEARHGCAIASGGTAPPGFPARFHPSDKNLSPGAPARLATNSLQSGYRIVQLVRFVQIVGQDLRLGSPPFRAVRGAETGIPANHGSSLRHISPPSGLAPLHPTSPRVPAGRRRWAERYDGKGNLHLFDAA
jgi:hypothetical protein